VVESGRKAIELIENTSFNLVLCDLHMPDIDGTPDFLRGGAHGSFLGSAFNAALTHTVLNLYLFFLLLGIGVVKAVRRKSHMDDSPIVST
jgi:hypothetical protein